MTRESRNSLTRRGFLVSGAAAAGMALGAGAARAKSEATIRCGFEATTPNREPLSTPRKSEVKVRP